MKFLFIVLYFLSLSTLKAVNTDTEIKKIISNMTLKEKIGQFFNIAIVGKTLKPEYKKLIEQYQIGGVTLFNYNIKNPKQVKSLIKELQSVSKIPMFISVDQEGGRITRYKKGNFFPPSPYLLGKLNNTEIVKKVAKYTAWDLLSVGINLNIAPVADILTTVKNKAIFDRSYGSNPEKVSKLVKNYVKSLQDNGVIAVIKHFPGQGSISQDTHKTLPYSKIEKQLLFKRDIMPFKTVIDEGLANVIMSSHVIFANIDPKYPATLSQKLLGDILRKKLKYNGIIFTDGLEMMAILKTFGLEKATLLALQGEVDVVTINWDLKNVKRALVYMEKAVKNKKLSEETIDKKLYRILKVKLKYLYSAPSPKSFSKKDADSFTKSLYQKAVRYQNVTINDLKNKKLYTTMKIFKRSLKIKYYGKIPANIKNSIIITNNLAYLTRKIRKNNIIIFLGPDIGINKGLKIIVLNENNKYTRMLLFEILKQL